MSHGQEAREAAFVKLLDIEGRTIEGAQRLMLDEIAMAWSRMRYPKSRRKRVAERYLRHRFGSLGI